MTEKQEKTNKENILVNSHNERQRMRIGQQKDNTSDNIRRNNRLSAIQTINHLLKSAL